MQSGEGGLSEGVGLPPGGGDGGDGDDGGGGGGDGDDGGGGGGDDGGGNDDDEDEKLLPGSICRLAEGQQGSPLKSLRFGQSYSKFDHSYLVHEFELHR